MYITEPNPEPGDMVCGGALAFRKNKNNLQWSPQWPLEY